MQNIVLLAELGALGVCPCRIYYFWQNSRYWVFAHAEFITFGRTEGIGHVSMQHLLFLAELKVLGVCPCRILLLLAELKVLGVCPCRIHYFWQN